MSTPGESTGAAHGATVLIVENQPQKKESLQQKDAEHGMDQ